MGDHTSRAIRRGWVIGALSGLLAIAALVAGSNWGQVSSHKLDPRLVAWISAAALVVFGAIATTRLSKVLARHTSATAAASAGGAVRIISAVVGYLIVIFAVLAELRVPIEKLLVGAGLAGIVLGIAAQQSLGNVFAGLILMLTRPFRVGDRVRVRSGALGGIFDARVREMSLTYVTLQTEEGEYKIPNSAMLAAGVARTPRTPLPQPATSQAPAKTTAGWPASPSGGGGSPSAPAGPQGPGTGDMAPAPAPPTLAPIEAPGATTAPGAVETAQPSEVPAERR